MKLIVKRRSRVLRRRTRQAALDKPRVHDGQLGFAILEQKAAETAENRAFEEKQPLVFAVSSPKTLSISHTARTLAHSSFLQVGISRLH